MENFAAGFPALAQGIFPTFLVADRPVEYVSGRDIGRVAAEALLRDGASPLAPGAREILELSGPRPASPRDVAAVLTRLLGRPIEVQQAPEDAMVGALQQHGVDPVVAAGLHEMTVSFNAGRIPFEGGSARRIHGSVDLDDALRSLLPPPSPAA